MTEQPTDEEIRRVEAWHKAQRADEIAIRRAESARKKAEAETKVAALFVNKTIKAVDFRGDGVEWAGEGMAEVYAMTVEFTDGSFVRVSGDYETRAVTLDYPKAESLPTNESEKP